MIGGVISIMPLVLQTENRIGYMSLIFILGLHRIIMVLVDKILFTQMLKKEI